MNGKEEVFKLILREINRLKRRRIAEIFAHAVKALGIASTADRTGIQLTRGIEPMLGLLTLLVDKTRIVGLFLGIDANQILVIEKKLGAKLKVGIAKVAEPAVLVLVPYLNELQIEVFSGENIAVLILKLA